MNQEGMDDRYYFSDWGSCTCNVDDDPENCPLCAEIDDFEEEED